MGSHSSTTRKAFPISLFSTRITTGISDITTKAPVAELISCGIELSTDTAARRMKLIAA